jgi:hypothetical protein
MCTLAQFRFSETPSRPQKKAAIYWSATRVNVVGLQERMRGEIAWVTVCTRIAVLRGSVPSWFHPFEPELAGFGL